MAFCFPAELYLVDLEGQVRCSLSGPAHHSLVALVWKAIKHMPVMRTLFPLSIPGCALYVLHPAYIFHPERVCPVRQPQWYQANTWPSIWVTPHLMTFTGVPSLNKPETCALCISQMITATPLQPWMRSAQFAGLQYVTLSQLTSL